MTCEGKIEQFEHFLQGTYFSEKNSVLFCVFQTQFVQRSISSRCCGTLWFDSFSFVPVTFLDIDECALPTGGHICSYRCHNTPGSFHCSCPINGYTLAPNGRSCQGMLSSLWRCTWRLQTCVNFSGTFKFLFVFCTQILMNVWQEHTHARRIRAALISREDSDACPSTARTTTGVLERREYLNCVSVEHPVSERDAHSTALNVLFVLIAVW